MVFLERRPNRLMGCRWLRSSVTGAAARSARCSLALLPSTCSVTALVALTCGNVAHAAPDRPELKWPDVQEDLTTWCLSNGLLVAYIREVGRPNIVVQTVISGGSSVEPAGMEGLAHLVEHLWFEAPVADGIPRWTAQRDHGIAANAHTEPVRWTFQTVAPKSALRALLSDEAQRFLQPLRDLTEADLLAEREVVRAEARERGWSVATAALYERMFGTTHPLGHIPIGTERGLETVTLALVQEGVAAWTPERSTVLLVADLPVETVGRLVNETLAVGISSEAPTCPRREIDASGPGERPSHTPFVVSQAIPASELLVGWLGPANPQEVDLAGPIARIIGDSLSEDFERDVVCSASDLDFGEFLSCSVPMEPADNAGTVANKVARRARRAIRNAAPEAALHWAVQLDRLVAPDILPWSYSAQRAIDIHRWGWHEIQTPPTSGKFFALALPWRDAVKRTQMATVLVQPGLGTGEGPAADVSRSRQPSATAVAPGAQRLVSLADDGANRTHGTFKLDNGMSVDWLNYGRQGRVLVSVILPVGPDRGKLQWDALKTGLRQPLEDPWHVKYDMAYGIEQYWSYGPAHMRLVAQAFNGDVALALARYTLEGAHYAAPKAEKSAPESKTEKEDTAEEEEEGSVKAWREWLDERYVQASGPPLGSPKELAAMWSSAVAPASLQLLLVGDFDEAGARDLASRWFDDYNIAPPERKAPEAPTAKAMPITPMVVGFAMPLQSTSAVQFVCPVSADPLGAVSSLGQFLITDALERKLRRGPGLVYSPSAELVQASDTGWLTITADAAHADIPEVLSIVKDIISAVPDTSKGVIWRAQEGAARARGAGFPSFEAAESWLARLVTAGTAPPSPSEFGDGLSAVDNEALRAWLAPCPLNHSTGLFGPRAALEPILTEAGLQLSWRTVE